MFGKVLDPKKQVTDSVLLSILAKQGIDKDFVEFYQDYASAYVNGKKVKGQSPYAKFYRDLISGKKFMVVSGLPMVDADGVKIECGWQIAGINYFSEKNNLFRAKVQGTDVELIVRNDQPDGRKANDRLSYHAQLFLNEIEQICGQPVLLPVDPVNSNYLENTLEWDYGICKRRLRIIEGRILGSWIFPTNPNGNVHIVYNQTGDYRLKLGQFATNNDEETISKIVFDSTPYPFTVSDSVTYNPDPHEEITSVDGYVMRASAGSTWNSLVINVGTSASDSGNDLYPAYFVSAEVNWSNISRAIMVFDTSPLPNDAIISAATLSIYGYSKADLDNNTPNINVYSVITASNIALAAGDYNLANWGVTAFSIAITYGNWSEIGYNNFALNADGIAAISKIDVTKFGTRNANYDVANSPPSSTGANRETGLWAWASEKGAVYKPKLYIEYSEAGAKNLYTGGISAKNRLNRMGDL